MTLELRARTKGTSLIHSHTHSYINLKKEGHLLSLPVQFAPASQSKGAVYGTLVLSMKISLRWALAA